MPAATCIFCHQPKAALSCGACLEPVCKGCVLRLDGEALRLRAEKPAALSHSAYCPICYDRHVSPALTEYETTLARAREACVWSRNYRGHIPVLKKARKQVEAKDFADKDELVLQLAFRASEMGFNALTDTEITSRKSRVNGYQKRLWSGSALPVLVDEEKLSREEFREAMHT
ncbi:MAG: hypothetical protein HYW49_03780 [Deltaproteobacteria bacterium]|nr:hypothetical protein [Deltaproteobacteria bacterium]